MSFEERLKIARSACKISQQRLAEKIFVSQAAYSKYEMGQATPNPDMLARLASELNVSADWLIGLTDEPKPVSKPSMVSSAELESIKKYRALDAHGKKMIDILLDGEYERTIADTGGETVKIAAREGGVSEQVISDAEAERLLNLPEIDDL